MRRRVHVTLRASTQARANTHRDAVENALAGRGIFDRDLTPTVEQDETGTWQVRAMIRFTGNVDADAVYDALVTRLQTNNQVASGSRVAWHDCTHDDGVPQPCVEQGVVIRA